jgi:gluconolactonase
MRRSLPFTCLTTLTVTAGLVACGSGETARDDDHAAAPARTIGHVERLDPELDVIVPEGAVFEILAEGHEWTEGPVWVPWLRMLLYSDIPRNAIYRWEEGDSAVLWLRPSGYTGDSARGGEPGSNGLALAGRALVLAQHGDRRIARLETRLTDPGPVFTTITDRFEGQRYNSPNDLVVHGSGAIYFTDPPYGLEGGVDDPAKELPVQGVYRVATDGSVTLLIDDLSRPNGIAFSPDERILYVANSDGDQPLIRAYDVAENGSISNGRVFAESWGDGMAVDREGRLFVTRGIDGVVVFAPDGRHLGTLVTGERTSNCAFGDDGSTLYVTSDMYLVRMRLTTIGTGFEPG